MNILRQDLIISIIVLALGMSSQLAIISDYPANVHAWAQFDRYALSMGFLDNGLNFFKPQTYVYNHPFPDNWQKPGDTTITAVDFPIHDFIPAVIMKLTNSRSPFIFRVYILLYSFIGLFFLFRLASRATGSFGKSMLTVLLAASSPVFAYYQGGFLPTIPSLANAIIGVYFYYLSMEETGGRRHFRLSLIFLTLSALARTTFVIPLVALMANELLRFARGASGIKSRALPMAIAAVIILGYRLYNNYLTTTYGTLFLNHLMPPSGNEQMAETLRQIYNNWSLHYFTRIHYILFLTVALTAAFFALKKLAPAARSVRSLSVFTLIYIVGCLLFAVVMLQQFVAHDYYFLDTFFLPCILLSMITLSVIPIPAGRVASISAIIVIALIALLLFNDSRQCVEMRRTAYYADRMENTLQNYSGAADFLDSVGIPMESKILVLDAVAPNVPFALMNRKGLVVLDVTQHNILNALNWNFDYVVFQNTYFLPIVYAAYPAIVSRLKKVADNGKITICKADPNKNRSLMELLQPQGYQPILADTLTFETPPNGNWKNITTTQEQAFEGLSCFHMTPETTYGLTYTHKAPDAMREHPTNIVITTQVLNSGKADCDVVVAINLGEELVYYASTKLQTAPDSSQTWQPVTLFFQLPAMEQADCDIAMYLFDPANTQLYLDNLVMVMY